MSKKNVLYLSIILILAMLLSACSSDDSAGTSKAEEKNYVWVLIDQMDDPGKASQESYDNVSYEVDYKPGDFGIHWTYTGETDASKNIMNGESWSGRYTYKGVPETLVPGEYLNLDFSVTEEENSLLGSWWVESLSSAYLFYELGSDPDLSDPHIYLKDERDVYHLIVNTYDEEFKPFTDKKLTALIPKGVPGNKITLTFNCDFTDAGVLKDQIRTVYRYEMKEQ